MNCEKIEKNLEEYLDGALSGGKKAVFDRHLLDCAACRRIVEERRGLGEKLTATMGHLVDGLETPPGLLGSIAREVRHPGRGSVYPFIRRPKLAAAAALPAAALILLLIFFPGGSNQYQTGGPGDPGAASYLELTTARHGPQEPQTVKRVYVARSNGEAGFLSLELIRDSKSPKEN